MEYVFKHKIKMTVRYGYAIVHFGRRHGYLDSKITIGGAALGHLRQLVGAFAGAAVSGGFAC